MPNSAARQPETTSDPSRRHIFYLHILTKRQEQNPQNDKL